MVIEIEVTIRSLNRHIKRLEAKLSFLIRSYDDSRTDLLYQYQRKIATQRKIAAVQQEIDDAMQQRWKLIREFNRALDHDIERLQAKLSFLIRSYDDLDTDLLHQYPGKIATVQQEIDYAMTQRRELEKLRQMHVARHSVSQKFINVKGYTIRYLEYAPPDISKTADSKILVLLPGLGASAERWSCVIPGLSRHFRVIAPDIIGFGYSDKPRDVKYTIDFFINDFFKVFLDKLHISKASIIGSSFGGHIATEFAIKFNHMVEKLVLVSPAGMMRRLTPALEKYFSAAMLPLDYLVHEAFREMVYDPNVVNEEMVKDFINRMGLTNAKYAFRSTLQQIGYARDDLRDRLSKITAPTLLLWGRNDKMVPIEYSEHFEHEIPNSRLVVIENCGHAPYLEKPTKFNKIVLKRV